MNGKMPASNPSIRMNSSPAAAHTPSQPIDLVLWTLLGVITVIWSRYTELDWQVTRLYYDTTAGGFPLRNQSLWSSAHGFTRNLSTVLWVLLLAYTIRQARVQRNADRVKACAFILLASTVALAVNGILKTYSVHSCPWSLTAFGGTADYFRLLDPVPLNAGSGGCLPSGHAAVGFMWWPVVYACARWRPSLTTLAFIGVVAFGGFCGYLQIVRGAHFISHVLMAAAVTGGCTSLMFHLCMRMRFWQGRPVTAFIQGLS